ncbi:VOC family protein [Gordonia sp. NPDC003376]
MIHGVTQLGYVGINATDVATWRRLGAHMGVEFGDIAGDGFGMRLDSDRDARVIVHAADTDGVAYTGWEVPGLRAFHDVADRLRAHGTSVEIRDDLARLRGAEDVARFTDPDGNAGELYWGMSTAIRTQFVSPHGVDFAVGEMGMGHMTIGVSDFRKTLEFYSEALGMTLSEIADVGAGRVAFLRCNPRHHSLAFAQLPPGLDPRVLHVAIEVTELDALGSIRDRLIDDHFPIARDLGRHPTDGVISMYVGASPAFEIELGWGSIVIDDQTWERDRHERVGWSWGHRQTTAGPTTRLGEDAVRS